MKRFFCALLCAALLVCACVPGLADTWLCRYCDKISNGNFCPYCGKYFVYARQSSVATWACPTCGESTNLDDASYCKSCGLPRSFAAGVTAGPTTPATPAPLFFATPTMAPLPMVTPTMAPLPFSTPAASTAVPVSNVARVGGTLQFGNYVQFASGAKTPILWDVLAVSNDMALLVSHYALYASSYHGTRTGVDWSQSELHSWLNNAFYVTAFSQAEQSKIVTVLNDGYSVDNVFLLSVDEVNAYLRTERKCVPTEAARLNGVSVTNAYTVDGVPTCWWWLRTPSDRAGYAKRVDNAGIVSDFTVNNGAGGVRPAIWVRLTNGKL